MTIAFSCPHCGRFTEVADEYAGQSGPCAGCGRTVTIPSSAASKTLKSSPLPKSAPQRTQRSGRKSNNSLVLILVVAALGGLCLCGGVMVALLLPAVQAAREAARRMECSNNLKQIALAMHNYHDVHKCLPAGYISDADGRPMHSWRVALLPYLERQDLYEQYNFDEPWDSPNNMRVAEQMPDVFRCSSSPLSGPGANTTHYVVVLGDKTQQGLESAFGGDRWTRFRDVKDGTSNTLMVVEAKTPVPWTQPDADPKFAQVMAGGVIGSYHPGGENFAMMDGSVQFLSQAVDPDTMRMLIQPDDGGQVMLPY